MYKTDLRMFSLQPTNSLSLPLSLSPSPLSPHLFFLVVLLMGFEFLLLSPSRRLILPWKVFFYEVIIKDLNLKELIGWLQLITRCQNNQTNNNNKTKGT